MKGWLALSGFYFTMFKDNASTIEGGKGALPYKQQEETYQYSLRLITEDYNWATQESIQRLCLPNCANLICLFNEIYVWLVKCTWI